MSDRDSEHWYPSPGDPNKLWPSVTTFRDAVMAKPALYGWNAREAARYAVENADLMAYIASTGWGEEAVKLATGEPGRIAGEAADLGLLLHRLAEEYVKYGSVTCTDEEMKAVEPFLDTLFAFLDEMQPVYRWAEATVYHEKLEYAGTSDCGVKFARPVPVVARRRLVHTFPPGTLLVGDYKTGKRIWGEAAPQLVAYGMCNRMDLKDALHTVRKMPRAEGGVVIHIRPDGYRVHGVLFTPGARAAVAHARKLFRYIRDEIPETLGMGVRGDGIHLADFEAGGLSKAVRNALALDGVFTLADLERYGEAALLAIHGAGLAAAERARELLALEGREWPAAARKGKVAA